MAFVPDFEDDPPAVAKSTREANRISPAAQRDADRDAVSILQQELAAVTENLKSTANPAQRARLQQDIIALGAELKRHGVTVSGQAPVAALVPAAAQGAPMRALAQPVLPTAESGSQVVMSGPPIRMQPMRHLAQTGIGATVDGRGEPATGGYAPTGIQGGVGIGDAPRLKAAGLGALDVFTAGGAKYPEAAVRSGSFNESLQDIRNRNASYQTDYPVASNIGRAGGMIAQGVLTGGVGPMANAALSAGTGAVGGFTENPYTTAPTAVKDMVKGAVISTIGALAPYVPASFVKSRLMKGIDTSIARATDEAKQGVKEAAEATRNLKAIVPSGKVTFDDLPPNVQANVWSKMTPAEREAVEEGRAALAEVTRLKKQAADRAADVEYLKARKTAVKEVNPLDALKQTRTLGGDPRGGIPMANTDWVKHRLNKALYGELGGVKEAIAPALLGGAAGAGYSTVTGGDPMQGLMYGVGGLGAGAGLSLLRPSVQSAGLNLGAKFLRAPTAMASRMAPAVGTVAAQSLVKDREEQFRPDF